jgi:hypothetical protein
MAVEKEDRVKDLGTGHEEIDNIRRPNTLFLVAATV